ncbi:MAG: hypothetical protein COV91_03770 [Candidatus Taylorbacteria bacterium CG11_big_fil_rev_8_21_14_0_20_46_11]|uniref:Uncharacterized protein n=1 Tax=Candidatus Taylorbacteria bacterium CG11_big_fil_rev_8_21_14_0_20_46_11 TaxID=1975025 RepID=A0A2H0KDM9_9BACT|nr:MAG: hypothetical protein COV91_03770 [Candidatus Taylorbacteria bacterium CG11_big_fil_rev_8_21_14_0_20_46_11]
MTIEKRKEKTVSVHSSLKSVIVARKKPTHPGQKVASEKKYQRRMAKSSKLPAFVQPDSFAKNFGLSGRIVSVGSQRNDVFLRQGVLVRNPENIAIAAFRLGGAPMPLPKPPAKKKEEKPVPVSQAPLAEINYYGEFYCQECGHYTKVALKGYSVVSKMNKSCEKCGKLHRVYRY